MPKSRSKELSIELCKTEQEVLPLLQGETWAP
jgi:hypothetical protein